ncbi:AAA family ATPase [Microbispora sp. CA-135349]|uniref:AAA family ATPase n=1 Tax=Microbispora sp. CA-135349 TaxID=3239953 RepID=UPI003D8D1958
MVAKPGHIFDRDWEWEALTSFVTGAQAEVAFGVVSGRRRQGKTFLLKNLAEALGGFHFEATEGTEIELLRLFGMALARHTGSPVGYPFADWRDALTFFFSLAGDRRTPLIIDEFPYLMKANPALPSILKQEIDLRGRTHGGASNARVLICGSALSVMGRILSGQAPLRGRARLELVVQSLSYRDAARVLGCAGRPASGGDAPRGRRRHPGLPGRVRAGRPAGVGRGLRPMGGPYGPRPEDVTVPGGALPAGGGARHPRPRPLPFGSLRGRGGQQHLGRHRRSHRVQVLRHRPSAQRPGGLRAAGQFDDDLRAEAGRDPAVLLVDLPALYGRG